MIHVALLAHRALNVALSAVLCVEFGAWIQPVRAAIPSFWDSFVIASYLGDSASALDVGVSAVLTIGKMQGGAAVLEARQYAHRSMPHVIVVDFIFDNTAGATPLVSNISQPGAWGGALPWQPCSAGGVPRRTLPHPCKHSVCWGRDYR